MGNETNTRREAAIKDFSEIVRKYILPMFDIRGSIKFIENTAPIINSELILIQEEKSGTVGMFFPKIGTEEDPAPFFYKIGLCYVDSVKRAAEITLRELLKVAEYKFSSDFVKKNHYGINEHSNISYKRRVFDLAYELGMCRSLTAKDEDAIVLHTVISRMIEWAGRTYEGKNVPFGIVVDFSIPESEKSADYLHFLENDCSAVFTDGIFTGIQLDRKGKIKSFLTRESVPEKVIEGHDVFVPFQFADLARFCIDSAVGIIALTNGEILLIKNQAVRYAKRGRKWVFFDWDRVYGNLRPYFLRAIPNEKRRPEDEQEVLFKIKEIYCTLLDVSFSHSGGCLAIVLPEYDAQVEKVVKERIDLLAQGDSIKGLNAAVREKVQVLTHLLSYPGNKMRSFFATEKQLRREILSLDGATVVSPNGSFYCAGSIVAVSGGSTGGGRTAAAKNLAQFGVGIKISEDGYIEAWGAPIWGKSEKPDRLIRLFSLK